MSFSTTCEGCDTALPPRKSGQRGQPRKWCSESCRVASYRPRQMHMCHVCGQAALNRANAKYCSDRCKNAANRKPAHETYECADCGRLTRRRTARGQRPKWCPSCRHRRRHPPAIKAEVREHVYRRDEGICQICLEPVDMSAPAGSDWAPTLDHVRCQAWDSEPDHSADNLRLAHHWCNSVRADERTYTDDDFRVAS